ncbi:Tkl protein kinase, partial [Globisporangium splendens]
MKLYTTSTASSTQQLKRAVHVDTRSSSSDPYPEPSAEKSPQSSNRSSLELHAAACRGDLACVQTLLEKASGIVNVVDLADGDGASALLLAAREGHTADRSQSTALQRAAQNGHVDVVKALLLASSAEKERTWINDVNASGYAALHCAAHSGSSAIVRLLLDHGANVEITSNGWRPLHTACFKNHIDVVQLLLVRGANVNAAMHDGVTALHYTARHGSTELAAVLLDAGADVNIGAGRSQTTPLHIAAMRGDLAMLQSRGAVLHGGRVRPLAGRQVPRKRRLGLNDALALTDPRRGRERIRGRAPVLAGQGRGRGPRRQLRSHTAVCRDRQGPTARDGVSAGARRECDARERPSRRVHVSALRGRAGSRRSREPAGRERRTHRRQVGRRVHAAAMHGAVPVVSVLLEEGADAYARGACEFTATHLAATTGQLGMLQYLVKNGYALDLEREVQHVTPMALATAAGYLEVVQYLVSTQGDRDQETSTRRRSEALIGAVEGGYLKIIKFLCAHGASIGVRATKDTTALHTAAGAGDTEVVEHLLRVQDADVHSRTSGGLTALHYASTAGHVDVADVVIAHGARVDEPVLESLEPDLVGTTPIHFAALYGHLDVLEALVRHGADLHARTAEGTGVITCAKEGDNKGETPRVVAFLRRHGATDE